MTHMPENSTINRFQKSGSVFALICHANLVPVPTDIRLVLALVQARKHWHACN